MNSIMPTIVIDQTTNFKAPAPVQQALGVIDEAYTDLINARAHRKALNKQLKELLEADEEYAKVETERVRVLANRKTIKNRVLQADHVFRVSSEAKLAQLEVEGKGEALSGHLVVYAKKGGQTIKIDDKQFYIKQSAKLENLKND